MTFNCKRCGACCKLFGCEHLRDIADGLTECAIYDTRPPICRFGFSKEAFGLTEEEYLALSYDSCERLRELVELNTLQPTS